jgi:hypothetical protein
MSNDLTNNYGFEPQKSFGDTSITQIEQSRAAQEVQAAYVIAKKFPRDENKAFAKIMKACERPFLADQAMYAYPRGGQVVTGPSIRLAEVLAQCWGNIDIGVVEISQANGVSVCKAYAIDLETNVPVSKTFHVVHERHTKKGVQKLTDPRDIYELVANNGARRLRACILGVIPGDIAEAAVKRCEETLTSGKDKEPFGDRIRKLILLFDEQGVKVDHIEKRLGHKLEATIPAELVTLGSIYKSLRDGMAKREDFFDMGNATATNLNVNELISAKKSANKPNISEKINSETGEILELSMFDKIKKQLENAKSIDTLDIAADLIVGVELDEKQDELRELYQEKRKLLGQSKT